MSLTAIRKDITTVEHGVILHGCNMQRAYRSGVAGAIRKKWPEAYESFMAVPSDKLVLGNVDKVKIDSSLWVFNCFTQEYYGRDGKRYASLEAIWMALEHGFTFATSCDLPVFMPKIGCGLGGLDWESAVGPLVDELRKETGALVTVYEI
jgi:O-acetyl-ADP-ribose deacetylase (regulator of RNase III)